MKTSACFSLERPTTRDIAVEGVVGHQLAADDDQVLLGILALQRPD